MKNYLPEEYFDTTNQLFRKMRTTCLILVVFATSLFATDVNSQIAKVNIAIKDAYLIQVIKAIESQTDYLFVYDKNEIDLTRKVDLVAENKSVTEILTYVFSNTNVVYAMEGTNIMLMQKSESQQQQKSVSGKVTDPTGALLPGVSIVVKGTTTGVITDSNGNYSISKVPDNATLVFSFVGMKTQEMRVGTQAIVNVTLEEETFGIDEVVAIGYGTQRKSTLTGSVSSIKARDLDKSTTANFAQALQGKVAGLTALQSTGQPGANVNVKIRSNPSQASSGVLYVLDGIPINDEAGDPGTSNSYESGGVERSPLNFINPNDIESIEVLKDASAASIYGARAGAGVVLITTKQGKGGKAKLEYTMSSAFQQPAKFFSVLSTGEFMAERNKFIKEVWLNANQIAPYGNTNPSTVPSYTPGYTDAQIAATPQQESAMKAISRNGLIVQHNLSLSGVNSGTSYYISGNYFTQQGVIRGSDYTRYNGRINLGQKVSDHVMVGINLTTSNSIAQNASVGQGTGENSGIISAAFIYPPILPFKDESGNYPLNPKYAKAANPLSFLTISDESVYSRLVTNGYAEWTIISGLKAKANFSYDQSASKRSNYEPRTFKYGNTVGGLASIGQNSNNTQSLEYTLNYEPDLGKNQTLNLLGGYSYQTTTFESLNAGNYGFVTDNFLYNNLGSGTSPRPIVGSGKSKLVLASYFARGIYNFKNRYLLQASVRRDGASNFAENKKYGIFPSVSAGWIVSDESFFKNKISFLNFTKLRAGYGTTGNSNIGSNANAYYSADGQWVFGGVINTGVYLSQLANPNLTWETARELNFGLDFQIMENRISGSFDYFIKNISNLLDSRPLASDFPIRSVAANIGETRSRGWEIEIQSRNIVSANKGGFEWNSALTLSHYYDSWVTRSPETLKTLPRYIDPQGPFNGIYGYRNDGIYTGATAAPAAMPGIIPGIMMIKDLNGYDDNGNLTGKPDGAISSADVTLIGVKDPRYSFGINNSFHYKNFDLSIYMYGISSLKFNEDYALSFNSQVEFNFVTREKNVLSILKDRWSSSNPNSKFPSGLESSYNDYGYESDFWNEDASFLRCRDITLGYTVPSNIIQKQKLVSRLNVSLAVQNVFILTKYRSIDPELQGYHAYPNPFSVVFGLNASF